MLADLSSGSYEFRDLGEPLGGTLFEGKVIYEKTYGHVTYGCMICCDESAPWLISDPLGIPLLGGAPNGVQTEDCNANTLDVSSRFYGNWTTANPAIATVATNGTHTGVAVGSTTSGTLGLLMTQHGRICYNTQQHAGGGDNVVRLTIEGNPYNSIFVGTDPNLATANSIFATVSPTGGTFTETSNQTGDTFTAVPSGGPGWVVHTTTQSANAGGRLLTVAYTVSGQGQVSRSLDVTAREFAYATNNSPSNTCTLGYGTKYLYTYTPYTHPDKIAVQPGLGLTGTAVTETFSSPPPGGTVTGSGWLDANSQFADQLTWCSTSPLTLSTSITQYLSIEGYQVRQNLLTYSTSGIALTNQGPTQ